MALVGNTSKQILLPTPAKLAMHRRWHKGRLKAVHMSGHGSKLGHKQEQAIAALLTQRNVEDAARAAGISVKTLLRWLKVPEFAAAYRAARRDAFSQSIARLQQASTAAATTLLKIMLDQSAPAACRVRAADTVLSHAMKAIEIEDVEERVAELERIAAVARENEDRG